MSAAIGFHALPGVMDEKPVATFTQVHDSQPRMLPRISIEL